MKAIQDVLQQESPALRGIIAKAARINNLSTRLVPLLPKEARSHIRVSEVKLGCLTMIVDSPVWKTHLHYRLPDILKLLTQADDCKDILRIEIKVGIFTPLPYLKKEPVYKKAEISEECRSALQHIADKTDSMVLKDALIRLSNMKKGAQTS